MSELISNKNKGNIDFNRKVIEYTCGCRYSFNQYTVLERVCPDHENQLIAQC